MAASPVEIPDSPGWTIESITTAIARKEASCLEVLEQSLSRMAQQDASIHAFLDRYEEDARAQALALDQSIALDEKPGPLTGVPIAIKNNICVRGWKTQAASKVLENYRAPYDAKVVERLRHEGAVLIGHTNMDEFAMGSSTEYSAHFPTKNPWDLSRVPGGSSGGSAAAVASEMVPVALGSDTGGSIRQPAAFCGVVGFKPSYGQVSRFGLIAFASSFDQIGPLGKTVQDCESVFEVIRGPDPRDSTTRVTPPSGQNSSPLRVARIPWKSRTVHPALAEAVDQAIKLLEEDGAQVSDGEPIEEEWLIPVYHVLASAEASSNLARYDGVRFGRIAHASTYDELVTQSRSEGFGPEVKRRLLLGTFALSRGFHEQTYGAAQLSRNRLTQRLQKQFESHDIIIGPVTPTTAFPLGSRLDAPSSMYDSDRFTLLANLAGLPALSLPFGLDQNSLPLAIQITGRAFDDDLVLEVGKRLEHLRGPGLRPPTSREPGS